MFLRGMKLKHEIFSLLILVFLLAIGCEEEPPILIGDTKYVGGIQINEADQVTWAKTLKDAGMNLAQVTAYAKQGDWDSDHIWWEDQDTVHVIKEIRAIKSRGVKVIMVLRVALQHNKPLNKFKWHGMIFPKNLEQRQEWFSRYNHLVEQWAKICEREGVDIFAIGSEMNALTATQELDSLPDLLNYFLDVENQQTHMGRIFKYQDKLEAEDLWVRGAENYQSQQMFINDKITEQKKWADAVCYNQVPGFLTRMNIDRTQLDTTWRNIIRNARKHYNGQMTLAANFDNYNEVSFWDELDCVGINAYFPLRKIQTQKLSDAQLYTELYNGWDTVFMNITDFKKKNNIENLPIFFTEIGYTPKADCTTAPWQGDGFNLLTNGEIDSLIIWKKAESRPKERVIALNALHDVVQDRHTPLLGLSYWKMTTHDYHTGYEPFMLLIAKEERDELQSALKQFLKYEEELE